MWCTKALDKVRRRTLEHAGDRDRNARWAVVKNPDDLTADQRQSLATIRTTNTALYRAYLLKEQLRAVFASKGAEENNSSAAGSPGHAAPDSTSSSHWPAPSNGSSS